MEKQLARIDVSVLYPPFVQKIKTLVQNCNDRGALYCATSGLRTFEQQDALYTIGRTTGKLGHIVTKARGGQSAHNFSCAVDFSYCTSLEPLRIDDHEANYRVLAEEATKLGLVSGLTWNSPLVDPNHVQWAVKQIGYSWADLTQVYRKGGYPAIWKLLDAWQERHGTI